MPFLTLNNNQNIGNSDFYRNTSTSLKPTKDDPQGSRGFVTQSLLLLGESLKNITLELLLPGISWFSGAKCSPCTPVFCYYQDRHEKPDRRSLSKRGYQVSQTVWSISWSKGYSIPLLTPVIPAAFGPKF